MAPDLQEHPDGDVVAAVVLPVYGPDGTCLTDLGPDPVVAAGGAPRTGEQRQVEAIRACPPGPELDAWLRDLDLDVLPSAVLVEVVAARARMESHQHAAMLDAIAVLASRQEMRPDWSPLAGAPPTQACVAGDELAMRLGWPRVTATRTVHRALVLDGLLGATREALEVGHVDAAKAQVLAAALTDLPFQVAHAVEDAVLPDADRCSLAQQFGLHVVAHAIQDDAYNRTRFAVICLPHTLATPAPSGQDCTSIIISVPNRPGAVHDLLVPLKKHGVSMTRFESRPARTGQWEYYFYIDLEGHPAQPNVASALEELRDLCAFYKVLGTYPVSK
jgi:hypothetical protein